VIRVGAGRVEDGDADYAVGVDWSQHTLTVGPTHFHLSRWA